MRRTLTTPLRSVTRERILSSRERKTLRRWIDTIPGAALLIQHPQDESRPVPFMNLRCDFFPSVSLSLSLPRRDFGRSVSRDNVVAAPPSMAHNLEGASRPFRLGCLRDGDQPGTSLAAGYPVRSTVNDPSIARCVRIHESSLLSSTLLLSLSPTLLVSSLF